MTKWARVFNVQDFELTYIEESKLASNLVQCSLEFNGQNFDNVYVLEEDLQFLDDLSEIEIFSDDSLIEQARWN